MLMMRLKRWKTRVKKAWKIKSTRSIKLFWKDEMRWVRQRRNLPRASISCRKKLTRIKSLLRLMSLKSKLRLRNLTVSLKTLSKRLKTSPKRWKTHAKIGKFSSVKIWTPSNKRRRTVWVHLRKISKSWSRQSAIWPTKMSHRPILMTRIPVSFKSDWTRQFKTSQRSLQRQIKLNRLVSKTNRKV